MSAFTTIITVIYVGIMVTRFMVNIEAEHYADALLNGAEMFMFLHIVNNI